MPILKEMDLPPSFSFPLFSAAPHNIQHYFSNLTLKEMLAGREQFEFSLQQQELDARSQAFFSILLTHEGSHREVYQDFQPSLTFSAGGAKGCSDHRFHAPPAYTAQLPTLHQHRANNQYRTANQI